MAAQQPVVQPGSAMVEVKNIFYKAHSTVNYFEDEVEADNIENDEAFRHYNRSLECSNKYGCLLMSFDKTFCLFRISDMLGGEETRSFEGLKKLVIVNDALPTTPNIIALSNGEEYLAVDTVRGGSAWVVVFKLADFINQSGSCRPLCEIRCSSSETVRVSGVGWNPGENMNNMIAINTDEGALFLAKINGPGSVELNRLPEMNVRCLCWSPKGKQLVIGRTNGFLSQLKLDLAVAKQIPPPDAGYLPVAVYWTQTTQFLVVFQKDVYVDFIQLDLAKGAPPLYTNNGDIFISDAVPAKCSCYFVPFTSWNAILAMTNSASDIVTLVKETRSNPSELWIPGDVTDNRRAAFFLDNYARGAAVFYGSESRVVFSEVESYAPMPIVFLLSQRGSLSSYSVCNSDANAVSLNVKMEAHLPDSIFTTSAARPNQQQQQPGVPPPQYTAPSQVSSPQVIKAAPQPQQPSLFQSSAASPLPTATLNFGSPAQPTLFQSPQSTFSQQQPSLLKSNQPQQQQQQGSLPVVSQQQHPATTTALQAKPQTQSPNLFSQQNQPGQIKPSTGQQQQTMPGMRQLGTPTLPTLDMAGLEKAVEEKRREMTTQLQKGGASGVSAKRAEEDEQCAFVVSEIRKFEQRMTERKGRMETERRSLNDLLKVSFGRLERSVLTTLNSVEDFSCDMVSTTNAQKEEVDVLKERILNHFSQLEYAKSLVERSRDPRYLEHLRSRPLDPASQQKFDEISKLHNYIKNQVSECRRFFYEQNRRRDLPLDRAPSTQLIYMTLSNHSKIIRRLKGELDNIKERLGLGKHANAFDEAEFLAVCEASYSGTKKSDQPSSTEQNNEDQDEITLNDLTAGISKVKLNRDSNRPDKKPIILSVRKLLILKQCMPEVSVVKVKADEVAWTRGSERKAKLKTASYPKVIPPVQDSFTRLETNAPPPSFGNTTFTIDKTSSISNTATSDASPLPKPAISSAAIPASFLGNSGTAAATTTTPSKIATQPPSMPAFASPGVLKSFSVSASSPTLAGLLANPPSVNPLTSKDTPVITNVGYGLPQLNISFGGSAGSKSLFGATPITTGTQKQASPAHVPSSATPPESSPIVIPKPPLQTAVSPSTFGEVTSTESQDAQAQDKSKSNSSTFAFGTSLSITPVTIKSSSTPTGLFTTSVAPVTSTANSTHNSGISTPINLSTDALKKESTIQTSVGSVGAGTIGGLFATSGLSFGSSSSGTSSIFGQIPTTKTTPGAAIIKVEPSASPPPTSSSAPVSVTPVSTTSTAPKAPTIISTSSSPIVTQVSVGFTATPPTAAAPTLVSSAGSTFTTNPAVSITTTSPSLFGSVTSTVSSPPGAANSSLFGAQPTIATTPNTTTVSNAGQTGLLGAAPAAAATSIFSIQPTQAPPTGGLFSSPITTTATETPPPPATTSPGLFSSPTSPTPGFFSQISNTSTPGVATGGFMSSLSISDQGNKPAVPSSTVSTGSLFSSAAFGASSPSTGSIFGGSSTFGAGAQSPTATQSPFGGTFGGAKPSTTTTSVFGGPAATTAASVFGGAPAFGSSSPFGSSFGGGSSTFGGASGGVFGGAATATSNQSAGFGSMAQQGNATTTAFGGGSPFGGGVQQASIFGSPAAQQKPPSGLFTSSFGNSATTTTGSIFGGGASAFGGSPTGGAFSSGTTAGGVEQQGFGFGQSKPAATGSVFGSSSPSGAGPVFGGGATFGSSSPFGSSFSSPAGSTFGGSSGGSVFGGTTTTQSGGFGSLAQQGSTSPGFGSPGFGGVNPQQQQQQSASLFGSPAQQQPAKPTFGGQAFSSWR